MKRVLLASSIVAVFSAASLLAVSAVGEPLWAKLVSTKRVEARPEADYELKEQHGPWLIMACTFSGEHAPEQAKELVIELRRRYKMEAYVHEEKFDFTERMRGRGLEPDGQPKRMKYRRDKQINEIAVLVGHYPTADDPRAQEDLTKIKYMRPDSLQWLTVEKDADGKVTGLNTIPDKKGSAQSLALLREMQSVMLPEGDKRKELGQMRKAFITRNPLLPEEYFVPKGLDKFVVEMNQGVKYGLLECPGKFSVQVATFGGVVEIDQKKVSDYENGKELKSKLESAAMNAHNMTLALREKGWEAYEFHDRNASMVTIGSFETVGTPRADGRTELLPEIVKIMDTFKAQSKAIPSSVAPKNTPMGFKIREIIGIPFDIQPQIVNVPRVGIGTQYQTNE